MNRKFTVLLLIVVLVSPALLFARGSSEAKGEEDKIVLEFWNMTTGIKIDWMKKKIAEFEELYPNVKVNAEFQAHTEYEKKLPAAIASGTAPDVWSQSYRLVTAYQDQIAPLTDDIAQAIGYTSAQDAQNSWVPAAIEQYMIDGQIYGFPWEYQNFAWVINKKHFRDAGLDPEKDYPKTWDDVIRIGKLLVKRQDGRIIQHPVTFPYSSPAVWYMMELQPILHGLGGALIGDDGTILVNSREAVEAMKVIKRRFDEGVTDAALSTTQDYMQAFQNGETSMGIASTLGWIDNWEKINPALKGELLGIPTPTFEGEPWYSAASSWAHSVNIKSKHKEWAWRFVDFMTKDVNSSLLEAGNLLPRKGWEETEGGKQLRQADLVAEAGAHSYPSGTVQHWDQIGAPMERAMQRILYQDADIQSELNRAKAEIEAAIR